MFILCQPGSGLKVTIRVHSKEKELKMKGMRFYWSCQINLNYKVKAKIFFEYLNFDLGGRKGFGFLI
jgi:hypothetical protein